MEELYHYFSALITFSIQCKIILGLLSLFEALDIFVYIFKTATILGLSVVEHNPKIIVTIENISIYSHFLKLSNCTVGNASNVIQCNEYPFPLLIISLLILALFPLVVLLIHKIKPNTKMKKSKTNCSIINTILINFYDHLVFRIFSIEIYDTIISFIIQNPTSYLFEIIGYLSLTVCLTISVVYLYLFRLCVVFDSKTKYPFDEEYSRLMDIGIFSLKILISFETWYSYSHSHLRYFFLMMIYLILGILSVYTVLWFDCIDSFNCLKGMYVLNYVFGFLFHISFCRLEYCWFFILLFIVMSIIIPIIMIVFLREYRLKKIILENDFKRKFGLLLYYYQSNGFDMILTRLSFKDKIIASKSGIKALQTFDTALRNEREKIQAKVNELLPYLDFISGELTKQNIKPYSKEEFIVTFIIVVKSLLASTSINFALVIQLNRYIAKIKHTNRTYYFNIKYYYQKLCEINFEMNNNRFNYLNSYSEIFDSINMFIKEIRSFIDNIHFLDTRDYFVLADHLDTFLKETKINYNILTVESKEEYQRTIMRIILENILNRPISKSHADILSNEDIQNYEDLFEKQYTLDNHLKIRIIIKTWKSKIIKVSKDLNFLYRKNIDSIFPRNYRHLAKQFFLNEIAQNDVHLFDTVSGCELYQFIFMDNCEDIRTFAYFYKIYHNLEEDILYLEGFYRLGTDALVITEDNGKDEYITLISTSLSNIIMFDQKFISFLLKYDVRLSLLSFSEYRIFDLNSYYEYLLKILKEISDICSFDEISLVHTIIDDIKKKETTYTQFWFNSIAKITDASKNKMVYLNKLEQYSCDVRKRKIKSKYNNDNNEIDQESSKKGKRFNNSFIPRITAFNTVFDTASISSTSTSLRNSPKMKNVVVRIESQKKLYKANNNIIIVLNFVVIGIAIFCLVFENSLNIDFYKTLFLYRTLYILNRSILHTMTSFMSLLCFSQSSFRKCEKRYQNYLNDHEGYSFLYDYTYLELNIKLNIIDELMHDFKVKLTEINDESLHNFLQSASNVYHLRYENGSFYGSYNEVDLNSVLTEFINKLIILVQNKVLLSMEVHPIILDDKFQVVSIIPGIIFLSSEQLYLYEVFSKYLEYASIFINYQKLIENIISDKTTNNKMSIAIFIIVIILSNFFILYLCWVFLNKFERLIKEKLGKIKLILAIESNVSLLKEKFVLINELQKLYSTNPTNIITKLINTTQKNKVSSFPSDKIKPNITDKVADPPIKQDDKSIDLSFITSYFFMLIIILGFVFAIYSSIFYVIFHFSFYQIHEITDILKTSAKMEEETSLSISLTHLLEYAYVPKEALFNLFYSNHTGSIDEEYGAIYDSKDFFLILINSIQISIQKEAMFHSNNSIYSIKDELLEFKCESIYSSYNDILYQKVFQNHKDKDYEKALINFCKSNEIMELKSEKLFKNELQYHNMKLLSIFSRNEISENNFYFDYKELYLLTSQFLFIFRPLRTYYGDYIFKIVLQSILNNHFAYLITFLIGNIILQIINFILIKLKIIDNMEKYNKNIEALYKALKST